VTEHAVFRTSLQIGLVALLNRLAAPLIAVLTLRLLVDLFGVDFDQSFAMLSVIAAAVCLVLFDQVGSSTGPITVPRTQIVTEVFVRWCVALAILLAIGYATKLSAVFSRRVLLTWGTLTPFLMMFVYLALREIGLRVARDPSNARKVLFAGFNETSVALRDRLRADSTSAMDVAGFFDDRSAERLGANGHSQEILGRLSDISSYVKTHRIDVIFVALPIRHVARVMQLLDELQDTTASIYYVPDLFVFDLIQSRATDIHGVPVVALCETPFSGYRGVIKRAMDVSIALTSILLLSPILLGIAAAVRLSSPGPVIFRQRRYGLDGREIVVYKFRTMTVTEDGERIVQASRDDRRVTPIGRFLRRYSLDELPQLLNVVQGRMSLIGPRPHAVAHNEEYRRLIKGYMVRHKVLPGITGLAQISGCRGETQTLEEMKTRIGFDLEYLRRWSIALDLKILLKTATQLLFDRKAY
jgi:putative colanic acid biosysnthesis UDP-glucose lipid carrier transferase